MPRLAYALETLRHQINTKFPNRSRASDGWIASAGHLDRTGAGAAASQHNPNAQDVVCAIDITEDLSVGLDCNRLMEELDASNDDRIFYLIHDREIDNSDDSRTPYHGSNPHTKHLHVSVKYKEAAKYDNNRPWGLPMLSTDGAPAPAPVPAPSGFRPIPLGGTTELNTSGEQVARDQRDLIDSGFSVGNSGADGYAGSATVGAIKAAQRGGGLLIDGAMGPRTRAMLHRVPSFSRKTTLLVQERLGNYGYRLVRDGKLGPKTKAAIAAFQARVGLTADRVVGPQTWTALFTR